MAEIDAGEIRDNPELNRYELELQDGTAILKYKREAGVVTLIHTEVPHELRGYGIAGRLARFALDSARDDGVKVRPLCPYVQEWLKKHPEYSDILV